MLILRVEKVGEYSDKSLLDRSRDPRWGAVKNGLKGNQARFEQPREEALKEEY